MAAQSFAMGHAFGTSFQYGKRKISSMTNEEFNKLDSVALHASLQADIRAMLPEMNQSFKTMEQFQLDIINSMFNTIKLAGEQLLGFLAGGGSSTETSTSAFNLGESGIFEIQGGSRQDNALTSDNPNSNLFLNEAGQTYDEWVAEGSQQTFAKIKSTNKKLERDIQKSRSAAKNVKPIIPITNAPVFQSPKQNLQHRKAQKVQLLKNIQSQTAKVKLLSLEYDRFIRHAANVLRNVKAGRATAKTGATIKRSLSLAKNILRDQQKKLSNMKQLLRNFKF